MSDKVSLVIPLYNEELYIDNLVDSLLLQTYPKTDMEFLFVDGGSSDRTLEILKQKQIDYPNLIKILYNPNRTTPYALNIGIEASKGKYILILGAHSEFPNDYVEKNINSLIKTGADNVGGLAYTKGKGENAKTIAKLLSSKFGVGNSQFRTKGESGYVDTVPFGAFPRETFEKYGLFDTRLTRNQDNELNYRIRKNGGKLYLDSDIHFFYYCRNTLKGLLQMGLNNGKWNVITMKLVPGSMGVRHFIPFVFLMSLIIMPILSVFFKPMLYLFIAELALYFLLDILFSVKASENPKEFLKLLAMYPLFHLSYGFGSLTGILNLHKFKNRKD